jgi:hypothetical protein
MKIMGAGERGWALKVVPMPDPARSRMPTPDEVRRLMHAMREAVGAFVLRVALLEDADLSESARDTRDAMLHDVERMSRALRAMTEAFGLEHHGSTPLAMLNPRRPRGERQAS